MMRPKIIYFDYHGVLDRRSFVGMRRMIAQNTKDPKRVEEDIERTLQHDYITNRMTPKEFWDTIERAYGLQAMMAAKKYFLHVDPIRENWELLNTLAKNIKIGLCTDCPADKMQTLRSAYALPEFFDVFLVSCETHLTKEEPEVYSLLTQNGQFAPEDILLVDDSSRNTLAAQMAHIPSFCYTDPASLKTMLASL